MGSASTLMTRALDEAGRHLRPVAETVDVSEDGSVYTFHLRPEARFHDGSPLTAEDVAFSYNLLRRRASQPRRACASWSRRGDRRHHGGADASPDERAATRILSLAGLSDLLQAYYADPRLRCGTLRAAARLRTLQGRRFAAGRYIEYERVADYWAARICRSTSASFNFDVIRIDFFAERQAAFEAFKKGDITFREEFTSITWATEYNFPAVIDGKVVMLDPSRSGRRSRASPSTLRRAKFRDPRTRQAVALAFDFEWSNPNLFFGAYERQISLLRIVRFRRGRTAGRGRAGAARAVPRRACRRRCSASPTCRR
jgi:microcin C transport system substrate-binding protein